MGDHFVLLVDRLLTESTLEAAIESRKSLKQAAIDETLIDCSPRKECEASLSPRKLVECRICQDEDVNSNMESPCSCCGSLKYAHRKCVQRWCNEKGDTVCEICHQQFKPGYTAPPPIFRFREIPMNLRGNWQIARRDLANPRLVTMASTDQNFLDPDYDEYEFSTRRSIIFCRSIAIIFMILLILRHTLPIIFSRAENYSCPLIVLLLLRIAGISLPICIILKAVTSIICHRQQLNEANLSITPSDEEAGQFTPHQLHVTPVY